MSSGLRCFRSVSVLAYRTITGVGTSPTQRDAAYKVLFSTTGSVFALSFLYAMMNGDDEDYLTKPTPTRDRLLMIPGTGMSIPLRADMYALPKVVAEHTYMLLTDKGFSDGAKFRASLKSLLATSILSPTPVPQAVKPLAGLKPAAISVSRRTMAVLKSRTPTTPKFFSSSWAVLLPRKV